jgi:hypothetical protein
MLSVNFFIVMLSVIMLIVIILSVVAPKNCSLVNIMVIHPLVHDGVEGVQELDHFHGAAALGHQAEVHHRAR